MRTHILIILTILALTGCATQTYNINGDTTALPTQEKSQAFFLQGIGQQKHTDAASICGGAENIIKVESEETFINILLRLVTFGIYTPRTARVYCKASV
jgi:uncharacterized lipoprotein YajG